MEVNQESIGGQPMETLEIYRGQVQDLAIKHRAKYALRGAHGRRPIGHIGAA